MYPPLLRTLVIWISKISNPRNTLDHGYGRESITIRLMGIVNYVMSYMPRSYSIDIKLKDGILIK